jgi:microcystin-dependent protein
MTEVYLGQIMMAGFNFATRGFALCNGQLLPVQQNAALFSLLGTQYGGNGQNTFGLPDLRSRTPAGSGQSVDPSWQPVPYTQGTPFGVENVSLTSSTMPMHTHVAGVTTANGVQRGPAGQLYSNIPTGGEPLYANPGAQVALNQATVGFAGSGQPHANIQPFTTISFAIALSGVFPARS